jgi:eukaryotic-like serine/threonine-protein kinase
MNRLGDAPTDMLFGLIALQNDMVAPEVISAALQAQAREPGRTLGELLVTQNALTPSQRDLIETLTREYISGHGGNPQKSLSTMIASPSARERLDQLGDIGPTASLPAAASANSTLPYEPDPRQNDPDRTLLPPANIVLNTYPQVAGFEIERVLGAGGMGIVYKAWQPALERSVALKMIRAGAGARPEDIVRFQAEAKAVAGIEHNNIVKIFGIGEQDGLPYFSLEYLSGGSLAQKVGGKPQPADEAARIVEILARAIHVAHGRKVIHRDLKPANILIADDGTLKITDFGLVKRLEGDSKQTRSGSILGTPSFMAPEQAKGDSQAVGPAADQYALGAILYDLLTGRPPFQGTSVLDTLDMVRGKEPVPPSQLQPKTPRDLETICLKCLEKVIDRRYPDVLALAEDLRRFSARETILARPVSDAEKLWRWCQRNRRVAALSAAVALLLMTVAIGSAIAAVKLANANAVAEQKRQEAERAAVTVSQKNQELGEANAVAEQKRQEAERKKKLAVAAARAANEQNRNGVEADVELIVLLTRTLRDVPAIQKIREQTLDKTIARLAAAAREMTNLRRDVDWDPKDEEINWRSLARAYQAQASVSRSRNQFTSAMEHYRQAEEIIARLAAADPSNLDLQVLLLKTQRELGNVSMYSLRDTEGAQKYFRRAIEISRACLAKKPGHDPYKIELANSLGKLAGSEMALGHLDKAHKLYLEEIQVRESLSPDQARDWEVRRELSGHYAELAALTARMGDLDEAQRLIDRCASIRDEVAAERPDSWPAQQGRALTYNLQGTMRFPMRGDAKAARAFFQKSLEIFGKRAQTDPADFENKHELVQTLYFDATSALHSGDKNGADKGYHECLRICEELATEPKPKGPQIFLMLAAARCGDHVRAANIAKSLVDVPPDNEELYIQAACGYALAAAAAGSDAGLAKLYTERAIHCVRTAQKRGWADLMTLEHDTDLEPIRNDPAFKTLLDEFRRPREKRS